MLDYFQASRDILLKVREAGGLPTTGVPLDWLERDVNARVDPAARAAREGDLAAFLKPCPPKTPAEALATFETTGGFKLEPLATEPMVQSPVAAAFDEDGNLYVAEMTRLSLQTPARAIARSGTIRLLVRHQRRRPLRRELRFADGLLWAAGVAPWKGGVFVASPPDIWYLKDTDGDHKADVRRKVSRGSGPNEQGMLNNLTSASTIRFMARRR